MARIRTIKPEFWSDEKLAPLDPMTRLVFLGLISHADDAGRLIDSVRQLDGLIFPFTGDTCVNALDVLCDLDVIERGVTANGQPVIQLVNWKIHQRIDKPNLKSAFPALAIASKTRRRKIPDRVREAILDRDEGVCQECGIEVKLGKDDKYDNDPRLAEIDHIIPVRDGGTNDPQNLRLTCLSCNRKKAGEDVRRRNQEASGKLPGNVSEGSAPRSTTNDLRPSTPDHGPTTSATSSTRAREDESGWGEVHTDAAEALEAMEHPGGRSGTRATLRTGFLYADEATAIPDSSVKGLPPPERMELVSRALIEMRADGVERWNTRALAGFIRRLRKPDQENTNGPRNRPPGPSRAQPNAGASTRKVHVER